MSKVLKDYEFNVEGKTIYDGKKALLVNILRSGSGKDDKELLKALESVPSSLQKYIISYIDHYRDVTENEFAGKVDGAFESARKNGYSEGFAEGRTAAIKSMEEGISGIFKAAESIENFKNELYRDVKKDVVDLSIGIARAIVKAETKINGDVIAGIISDIINAASESVRFTVCLNPSDYNALSKHPETVRDLVAKRTAEIEFLPDASLLPGDTVIKTDFGEIDARIETQIEQIGKIFAKIVPE